MVNAQPRLVSSDNCPTLEQEPLSATEWRVLAHWLTHYPELRREPWLTQFVREVCWQAEPRLIEMMLRDPTLKAADALIQCVVPPILAES